jgi:dTMP kinase
MTDQSSKSCLIIFEGIDGVGKTTQRDLAADALESNGLHVIKRRNLGSTPIGEALREILLSPMDRPSTTNLYISVAIQSALIEQIVKDKSSGHVILMDRGPLSLAAYEIFGSQLDGGLGWQHIDNGMDSLQPDLTIIYDIDVSQALNRAKNEAVPADYFESKSKEYYLRVSEGYKDLAKRYSNVVLIDASSAIESVHQKTMNAIRTALDTHSPN